MNIESMKFKRFHHDVCEDDMGVNVFDTLKPHIIEAIEFCKNEGFDDVKVLFVPTDSNGISFTELVRVNGECIMLIGLSQPVLRNAGITDNTEFSKAIINWFKKIDGEMNGNANC